MERRRALKNDVFRRSLIHFEKYNATKKGHRGKKAARPQILFMFDVTSEIIY